MLILECLCLTSDLRDIIWLHLALAAPISSMLSGRFDNVSIDSVTKLSIACVWPAQKIKETNKNTQKNIRTEE